MCDLFRAAHDYVCRLDGIMIGHSNVDELSRIRSRLQSFAIATSSEL